MACTINFGKALIHVLFFFPPCPHIIYPKLKSTDLFFKGDIIKE